MRTAPSKIASCTRRRGPGLPPHVSGLALAAVGAFCGLAAQVIRSRLPQDMALRPVPIPVMVRRRHPW